MAAAVPQKGGLGKYGTDKCLEFIEENGDKEGSVIVKTDQEASIEYLVKDLMFERPEGKTISEEAPKQSSGSNGVVERGVLEVEGKMRAAYLQLCENRFEGENNCLYSRICYVFDESVKERR